MRPVDWAIVAYSALSAAVIVVGAPELPAWEWMLGARAVLVAGVVALSRARGSAVDLVRNIYPIAVVPQFFWGAPRFAGALYGEPWAFESTLWAWDRALFGAATTPEAFPLPMPAAELLWALYFAYYPIVAGGLLAARSVGRRPGERFGPAWPPVLTAATLGFLGAFALFPFFPARAPIHALPDVAPAAGPVFGALVAWVQSWGGIVGGAFPSAHVAAAWAVSLSLARVRPRAGRTLTLLAAGMTVACVWTPYHWAGDVAAGLIIGLVAGLASGRVGGAAGSRVVTESYGLSRQTATRAESTPG
ncbi:MAG TPA: phosphatase PAP2 family protein [Gemmatimonadota bacterium]|nr:phosphatase PAP2 family protein [Gemmatimonadota bacterium]